MLSIKQKVFEIKGLFPPDSAGFNMVSEIPIVHPDAKISDIIKIVLEEINFFATINYIYVVDEKRKLLGVLSIKELLRSPKKEKIKNLMKQKLVSVDPLAKQERVALLALQHNLKSVPVVDSQNRLLGIFTSDQLLDLLNKEISRYLVKISGVRYFDQPLISISTLNIVRARLPWILFGVVGGVITGLIIGVFKATLESAIVLAIYIPVIMSTGANTLNQSAMIFIRNLVSGNVKGALHYFWKEVKIGLLIGLVCSFLLLIISFFWQGSLLLALVVSISIFATVVFSATIGVLVPIVLYQFKIDPAIGAGPFLTSIKDIVSMLIYFSIATYLLGHLF